jgi:K+-sensing histidine kinase KdpD
MKGASAALQSAIARMPWGVTVGSDGVEIAVEDDGPDFPEHQLARVGERFARGQSRGSSLGLSIVRGIAALHGGGVTISRSLAGGRIAPARSLRCQRPMNRSRRRRRRSAPR